MAEYRKYDNMQNTNLSWLKEIPSHWMLFQMKSIFQNITDKDHPQAEVLSLYREHGILPKNSRTDNHNVTSEDTTSYKYVQIGDLVINKMKAWQGSLAVSNFEGIVSPAYYVCRFKSNQYIKRYFHYLLRCKAYAQEFERLSTGMRIGQWDLNINDFMHVPVIVPPTSEQEAIAFYLDNQCLQIDSIIEYAKSSIEEYKKWKASLIFEIVTKGINKAATVQCPKAKWFRELPISWKLQKIKYLVEQKTLRAEKNDEYIGLENIESGSGKFIACSNKNSIAESSTLKTAVGDVIFGKLRPYLAKCHIIEKSGCCSSEFLVLNPIYCVPRYLKYIMLSPKFIDFVNMSTYGTKMPRANWDFIGNILIPYPSQEEQIEIADYLDCECFKMDSLINEKLTLIADLENYKRSLIYEIVTGKRKVV